MFDTLDLVDLPDTMDVATYSPCANDTTCFFEKTSSRKSRDTAAPLSPYLTNAKGSKPRQVDNGTTQRIATSGSCVNDNGRKPISEEIATLQDQLCRKLLEYERLKSTNMEHLRKWQHHLEAEHALQFIL